MKFGVGGPTKDIRRSKYKHDSISTCNRELYVQYMQNRNRGIYSPMFFCQFQLPVAW